MKQRGCLLLILVALGLSSALSATLQVSSPTAERESLQRAAKVQAVFEQIEEDHRAGRKEPKSHLLLEPDLNAFLEWQVKAQRPPAVERLSVSLHTEDRFATRIRVNLDEVSLGDSSMGGLFKALLSGSQDLEVEGRLEAADGTGAYRVEGASLNGLPIPASLVNTILKSVGARLDPPFDPTAPFPLGHGIRAIHIAPGRATIETGG